MDNITFEEVYRAAITIPGERIVPPGEECEAVYNYIIHLVNEIKKENIELEEIIEELEKENIELREQNDYII